MRARRTVLLPDTAMVRGAVSLVAIGEPSWTRDELVGALAEFAELYEQRPITDNCGGMQAPQLFCAWFALRRLKPSVIVESGIFLGQGTWFFERACPDAELLCIDPALERIRYRSARARYYATDFSRLDLTGLVAEDTVLFFDDHQNAYERLKTAKWMGLSRMLFEDNYPAGRGDCYSLKKAFAGAGFEPEEPPRTLRRDLAGWLGVTSTEPSRVAPNDVDAAYLRRNVRIYYEFPPVVKSERTRFGDAWDSERYPTPAPLLERVTEDWQRVYEREAQQYTWIAYVELG